MTPTDDMAAGGRRGVQHVRHPRERGQPALRQPRASEAAEGQRSRPCGSSWPGCLAQKDRGEIQRRAPWVDVVVGTHALPASARAAGRVGARRTADGRPRVHGGLPQRAAGGAARRRSARGCRSRPGATTRARSASCRSSAARNGRARSATSSPRCRGCRRERGRRGHAARPEREHVRPRRDRARARRAGRCSPSCSVRWARSRASGACGSRRRTLTTSRPT